MKTLETIPAGFPAKARAPINPISGRFETTIWHGERGVHYSTEPQAMPKDGGSHAAGQWAEAPAVELVGKW